MSSTRKARRDVHGHALARLRRLHGRSTVLRTVAMVCVGLAGGTNVARAQDSTQPLLGAVKLVDTLWIQQTAGALDYAVNDNAREFLPLRPGVTFVAPGDIKLAWKALNPLAIAVSASETSVADPNHAQLTQFLDTLAKLPDLVSKPQSATLRTCPGIGEASETLERLQNALNTSSSVAGKLVEWRKTLTDQPGRAAVVTVQADMGTVVGNLREGVKRARAQWSEIERLAEAGAAAIKLAAATQQAADQKDRADKAASEKAAAEKALADRIAAEQAAAAAKTNPGGIRAAMAERSRMWP